MTHPTEFVGFDDLDLPLLDAETVKAQVARAAEKLHADGSLRIHFTKHQHPGARPKFSVHLFFDHDGHKHTSDKHHGWELAEVVKDAFKALETQIEKERTRHER